jgi:hypothetical protein
MTVRPVVTELFDAGRRTDITKLIIVHRPKITKFRGRDQSSSSDTTVDNQLGPTGTAVRTMSPWCVSLCYLLTETDRDSETYCC